MKVYVGFVGGDTAVDKAIQWATGSEYCNITHVFLPFSDGIIEAEGVKQYNDKYAGVWKHDLSKYDDNGNVKIVAVDIPDYDAYRKQAVELIGTPYGYEDCIAAVAYLATHEELMSSNGTKTCNCSETGTRCLRAGGMSLLQGKPADIVSPVMLYNALMDKHEGVLIEWQQMKQELLA